MITRFQATGARAGSAKWWYVFRIPTTIPESPRSTTIGNRTRERPTARSKSPPGSPNGRIRSGASRIKRAVTPPRTSSVSQKSVDATRHARFLSPRSRSSLKTGTNAPESAASATSARTRFGIWIATVKALISPEMPK